MESIYSLQQRADTLRQKTLVDSISPEEVGSLHADTLAYLADMEQNAEGLGIHKVYKSFAAMNADSSAPVGTNGKPLRFGQLVAVYDKDYQSQAENGNIYAFQKGAEAGWLLMGNLNSIGEVTAKIAAIKSDIAGLKDKDLEHDKALEKKANAEEVNNSMQELSTESKTTALYPKALLYTDGYFVRSDGELNQHEGSKYYGYFKVTEGETIVYTGNYGGSCLAIAYYDENYKFLSGESRADLGAPSTYEFTVPASAVYAIASTFNRTLDVYIKDGVIDTINSLEENKLNKEEFNKTVVVIKRNEDVLNKTAALYPKTLPYTDGYFVRSDGELNKHEGSKYYGYFKVTEGETIVYTGNYGGACLAIAYYDENYKFLSGESRADLGAPSTYEFTVPASAVYAIASTFKGNFDVRLSNGLIKDVEALQKSKEELNSDIKQSLSKKFRNFDERFAYMREVDRAVLFTAFVPKEGYENDDMKIIALSAYYNKLADDEIPTRFDFWVYNGTKQKDFYQYINKDVNNQNRYQKIYYTGEMGTLYALIDTDVLRAHKNTDNKYTYLIWGAGSKFIINTYRSVDENPFLNPTLWENNKKNPHTFTIAWFGTSIPASSYPAVVGSLLGCTVYNEAVGESLVRLGWGKNCIASGDTIDKWGCSGKDTSKFNPISNTLAALAKSLSASIEEKQYFIDNLDHFKEITNYSGNFPYTNEQIKGFSYENKLLKYIDSSRQDYIKTDLIVFDHGHNDLNPDGDPVWSSYDIANRTKDNYWGAMNFLMDIIRKYNPHQNVCQISHYQGNVDYSAYYYKTQQKFAEHWGIPFIELYKVTQLSTTEKVRTSGWWGYTDGLWHESGFVFKKNSDGTFTTNQSCIIQYDFGISNGSYDTTSQTFTSKIMEIPTTTTSRDIKEEDGKTTCLLSPRESFMKDRLHPLSDKSKVAVNRIAEWLASMLNSIYKIQ